MASGKKNYFRHSFNARNDEFVIELINQFKEKGYFMWFALVEMSAEMLADGHEQPLKFNRSRLIRELRCNESTLKVFLTYCEGRSKVLHTYLEPTYNLEIPNLPKYVGKYSENAPNKRKENKRKEKEIEGAPSASIALVEPAEKNLSEDQPQDFRNPKDSEKTNTELFAVDTIHPLEEEKCSDLARNVLTALNAICFRSFRPSKTNVKLVNARIKEGYSLEDFTTVFHFKQNQWGSDPKMAEYLRPATLLSNKFESYLEAAKAADAPMTEAQADEIIRQYWPGA